MNMKRIVLAGILSLFALFSYAQEYQYHFLLAGASFAVPENGWFELVCDAFNAEAMNKAVSGDAIKHTASDMFYDRFYTDEELERNDAFIIMHVHNQDVASTTGIKENYEDYTHADIQQYNTAYDYVIKRYKTDCYNLKNNPNSKYYQTENGKPARDSKENVYNQIVADLLQAESIMADDYVRAGVTDKAATPTKPAIQALLSRVYLYMNKWQEAADYATKVINNKKYELAPADAYAAMFSAATAPEGGEIIFEVYGSDKNEYWDNSGWAHLPYITTTDENGSHGDVCATKDLYDLYSEGDVRKSMFKQHGNDYFPTKYSGKPKDSDPKYTNVPILRLSEMYLNRAEAIINGASIQGVTAESDLRKIATVRGASQTAAATKQGVFDERRRELAFEGHITADYARCNKSMTRKDFDDSKNKDVAFPSYMWALPIPHRERTANPNVAQNPGY